MVLFVRPEEEGVEVLLWGDRVNVAYLGNEEWRWPSSVWVGFKSNAYIKRLYVMMRFAANAVRAWQYLYYSKQLVFSLYIKGSYYMYGWCEYPIYAPNGKSLNNTCSPNNNYVFFDLDELGGLSLKPPISLYTVVPTQISSLI